ncbi:MAG: hypothetical protein M1823_002702 [Watsoniomyces obsoletus]|nr:MAG: hypothetical protein M1823_002702 [Watsoniomyces obsoletus]
MTLTLSLPNDYGYVVLAATASALMQNWLSFTVADLRKRAKLPYPHAYASDSAIKTDAAAYAYNCGQRAQANVAENITPLMASLLIAGLEYPKTAAAMGAAWVLSRVMFTVGYTRSQMGSGGKGRMIGAWGSVLQLGLELMAGYTGFNMLRK